jgi:NAD(P)H dehydrogenase (quinone)
MTSPTLFIAGAAGHFGRRAVELLLERGYDGKIIIGSRTPEKLAGIAGVEVRKADFDDVPGFTAALSGADRLLFISVDAVGEVRERLHGNAVKAAKAAGIKHIVYTSMPHPEAGNPVPMAAGHYFTEQAIEDSGIEFTVLRNSWYAENLLQALAPAIQSGKWFTASGEGLISHVTREDTAKAAVGALVSDYKGSRVLTVSGAQALSIAQIAAIASEVIGKPIEVVQVSDAQYIEGLKAVGIPAGVAEFVATFEVLQREGGLSMVTNAVEKLSGDKPVTVREFLAANRAALVQAA